MTQSHGTFSGRKHHESLSLDHVELSFSESDETVSKTGILGCAGQEELGGGGAVSKYCNMECFHDTLRHR